MNSAEQAVRIERAEVKRPGGLGQAQRTYRVTVELSVQAESPGAALSAIESRLTPRSTS